MNSRLVQTLAALALATLLACSSAQPPPPPASFSRPEKLAFVCLETSDTLVTAKPLKDCKDPRNTKNNPRMHALVTQTSTGEVAAVDLGDKRVLDIRYDIPGYTFVDVGLLPTSIVVPEVASEFTYIGSATGEIGVFHSAAFRPLIDRGVIARVQDPPMRLPGLARPSAMLMTPNEEALIVASESSGELFVVPVCRDEAACELGTLLEPQRITLPTMPASSTPHRGPEGEAYFSKNQCDNFQFVFADEPAWSDAGVTTPRMDAGVDEDAGVLSDGGMGAVSTARPSALVIDSACDGKKSCPPRLLVADNSQPYIHRFELSGITLSAIDPWPTGVPIEALVVTPDVPVTLEGSGKTHYVYGIDYNDGSIMVLQDGALLPVNASPEAAVDRLSMDTEPKGTRALSLAIMTPGNARNMCEEARSPTELRGVFLVAGLSNGHLLVYDIHDYNIVDTIDTAARQMENDSIAAKNKMPADAGTPCRSCPYVIKRHQPRIATSFESFPVDSVLAPTVSTVPRYFMGSRVLSVGSDGKTRDTRLPELQCIKCPEGMTRAYTNPLVTTVVSEGAGSMLGTGGMQMTGGIGYGWTGAGGTEASGGGMQSAGGDQGAGGTEASGGGMQSTGGDQGGGGMSGAGGSEDSGGGLCSEDEALICVQADPYQSLPSAWSLTYEGRLPGTLGVGYFVGATSHHEFHLGQSTRGTLCDSGVLGSDVLDNEGDQLAILSEPVELADDSEACKTLQKALHDHSAALSVPITHAFADHLEVGEDLIKTAISDPSVRSKLPDSLQDALKCYPGEGEQTGLLSFAVHARNSFLLVGSNGTFDHRVIADEDGRCAFNQSLPATLSSRVQVQAAENKDATQFYSNGRVAFSLVNGGADIPKDLGVVLLISLSNSPFKLIYDASYRGSSYSPQGGVLPQSMMYNPRDQRLYVVDPHIRGLFDIPASDFSFAGSVEQYN